MQKLIIAAVLASVLATGAVAQDYENSSVVGQVPDRVLVTVKPGVTLNLDKSAGAPRVGVPALDTLAEKYAVRDMEPLYGGLANKLDKAAADIADRVWAIDFDARFDRHDVKAAYERLPEVEEVHLVDICKMYDAFLPDDPGLGSQWFLRNMNLGGGDIRAVGGWSHALGDSNIVVCILDSGLDWNHPDLGGPHPDKVNGAVWTNWTEYYGTPGVDDDANGKIDDIRGWDFVNTAASNGWPDEDVTTPDNDPSDYESHGTNCAGTVGAITNNGLGVAGAAPGVKLMAARVGYLPAGTSQGVVRMDWVAQGILYAVANGADIINCSWGSSSSISFAVGTAISEGVLMVTAAGNDDSELDPSYLSTYPGVIAVAATDPSDGRASFSNYGTWVELSAPGTGIYTTTYNATLDTHTYSTTQGTSFSSPIVCGAAALIWSANPSLTATQVTQILYASADDIDGVNPSYAGKLGAGRVNLLAALGDAQHRYPQEFPTLFDAINGAKAGDEIAIAASATITGTLEILGKDLQVLGGYSSDFTTRDPINNPTPINAPANSSGLRFTGTVGNGTVIDGFVISGGGGQTFSGIPYSAKYGGGVMLNGTSPTLRNIELTGNSVGDASQLGCGGGLAMNNASPVLENVHIHGNTGIYGAGVFMNNSTPTFTGCVIEDNVVITSNLTYPPNGGGLHAVGSDPVLVDTRISGHLDLVNGGGIFLGGASTLDMTGGEVSGNTAKDNGGGIYVNGGALTARRVQVSDNAKTATSTFMHGGGIFATAATVALDSLTCIDNFGMVGGGMELNANTSASVTNSLVANNTGQFWGGGIAFDGNLAGEVTGNTIAYNSSLTGGAGLYVNASAPAVSNNISAFNTGGATYGNGMALLSAPSVLSCNDVFGNDNAGYSGQPDPTGTNGNIAEDPLFCNGVVGLPGPADKDAFDDATGFGYVIAPESGCAAANSGGCGLIGAFAAGSCGGNPVPDEGGAVPALFRVERAFPNPFNPRTTIRFSLPTAAQTRVEIFDVAGRHVRTLVDGRLPADVHEVTWTGDDDDGRAVSAGVYFYLVRSGADRSVGRVALVK